MQQQQQVQQPKAISQPQQALSRRPALAPANTQRVSGGSCMGAASLLTKQPQQASRGMWPLLGDGQRQSGKAGKPSGSTTRFPLISLQPSGGFEPLSGSSLLRQASLLGGSFGGAGGSSGAAGRLQRQQQQSAGFASPGSWGLDEQAEEENGPVADLVGCSPQYGLPGSSRQLLGGSGGDSGLQVWQAGDAGAAMDRLFAVRSSGGGRRQQAASLQGGHEAMGLPLEQPGADDELERLFHTTKRQRLGQQKQQGQQEGGAIEEAELSWWGEQPEQAQADAAGWGSRGGGGPAPSGDFGMQQDEPWQLLPRGLQRGWDQQGRAAPALPPQRLWQREAAVQQGAGQPPQQQQQDDLLTAEPLPAFLAPSPTAQQRQQAHDWEADGLAGGFGGSWEAASSDSDDLPDFSF